MSPEQRMVKEFHDHFVGDAKAEPQLVDPQVLLLRARLIVEEAAEFLEAASNANLVKMADALVDILYVTYGAANVLGIDLEPLFSEVHRSNMTKQAVRDSGGKVTKGPDWSPPQLEAKLKDQGWPR